MPNITELNQELSKAIASGNTNKIKEASEKIADIVNMDKKQQKQQESKNRYESYIGKIKAIAVKYPCLACGGKLKQDNFRVPYNLIETLDKPDIMGNGGISGVQYAECYFNCQFYCSACDRMSLRNIDNEDRIQEALKERIRHFKKILLEMIKIYDKKDIQFNDDLTIVNNKPFCVFRRQDLDRYPYVLAYEHGKNGERYNHESLRNGHEDRWDYNLYQVATIFFILFNINDKEEQSLLRGKFWNAFPNDCNRIKPQWFKK